MAMLLQSADQARQDSLETLTTDSVRGFPQYEQRFAYRLVIGPPTNPSYGVR